VIKKQVDEELVAGNLQPELPADKGKARAQFQQKARDVADQTVFDFPLVGVIAQAQEVKQVRVLERLAGQRRLGSRQPSLKVRHRAALALLQPVLDVQRKCHARPAVLHCLRRIPLAVSCVVQLRQERHDVEPRQLVSRLLTKLAVRAMLGEKPHVLEVARRPAAHVRKGVLEVSGQAVDDLGAPALPLLALQDVASDAAVELHQLGIDRQRRALPGLGNLALELGQPVGVALGQGERGAAGGRHAQVSSSSASASSRRSWPEIRRGSSVSRRVARVWACAWFS
jgi:hypothetical protein